MLVSATRTDPDLWGHVRFGLDWLRTGDLPVQDPYWSTQDRPWVNHEWLSEAAIGAAYQLGGTSGVVTLKTLVMAGAIAVIARRMRGASPVVSAAVMTVAIVGALPLSGTVRPQIWSALCLALLVPILTLEPPTPARVGAAVVLFGTWANLHGGWITGGAALALHVAIRVIRAPHQALAWLGLGAGSLFATLCNPYGAGLWRFLATTVRPSRPDITEWRQFSVQEPAIMWVSIVGTLLALLFVARRRETRPPIEITAVVSCSLPQVCTYRAWRRSCARRRSRCSHPGSEWRLGTQDASPRRHRPLRQCCSFLQRSRSRRPERPSRRS